MARPKHEHPPPAELEVLQILWDQGPATVRDVMERLEPSRSRAYTSVMSLLNVMTDKGLVTRKPQGRAFIYAAKAPRGKTLGRMVRDLLGRAFQGSTAALVAHLLEQARPSSDELNEIRKTIESYKQEKRGE